MYGESFGLRVAHFRNGKSCGRQLYFQPTPDRLNVFTLGCTRRGQAGQHYLLHRVPTGIDTSSGHRRAVVRYFLRDDPMCRAGFGELARLAKGYSDLGVSDDRGDQLRRASATDPPHAERSGCFVDHPDLPFNTWQDGKRGPISEIDLHQPEQEGLV
jgi:hypothetical protein